MRMRKRFLVLIIHALCIHQFLLPVRTLGCVWAWVGLCRSGPHTPKVEGWRTIISTCILVTWPFRTSWPIFCSFLLFLLKLTMTYTNTSALRNAEGFRHWGPWGKEDGDRRRESPLVSNQPGRICGIWWITGWSKWIFWKFLVPFLLPCTKAKLITCQSNLSCSPYPGFSGEASWSNHIGPPTFSW